MPLSSSLEAHRLVGHRGPPGEVELATRPSPCFCTTIVDRSWPPALPPACDPPRPAGSWRRSSRRRHLGDDVALLVIPARMAGACFFKPFPAVSPVVDSGQLRNPRPPKLSPAGPAPSIPCTVGAGAATVRSSGELLLELGGVIMSRCRFWGERGCRGREGKDLPSSLNGESSRMGVDVCGNSKSPWTHPRR